MGEMKRYGLRLVRVACIAVLSGLLGFGLIPRSASAQETGCRSDPYVLLSNGVQLDLSANIADSVSDVHQTVYILHAPRGTTPVAVVPTDGLMGWTEKFYFYADQAPDTYTTDTAIYTGQSGVQVTAVDAVVSVANTAVKTDSGTSGQYLPVNLTN